MAKTLKKLIIPGFVVCLAASIGLMASACTSNNPDDEDTDKTNTGSATYTVSFDLQESVINDANLTIQSKPEAQTVKENEYATEPAAPIAYWTFGGWYKEAACTNAFEFTTEKITADTTLYAKWTAPECPTWDFAKVNHFYMSGYEGTIAEGSPYSTENVWESTNNFVDPPVTTTYTYNHVNLKAGEFICVMWHLDGVVADTTYKLDIRLGDEFKQDASVRAGLNIWTQDASSTDKNAPYLYSELARKFGLIGLQVEFSDEELTNLNMGGVAMYKVIIQNPTDQDFDLRIVCAVGDAH